MDQLVFEETRATEADEKIHGLVKKMFVSESYTQALILQHLRSEVLWYAKKHNARRITLYVGNELGLKIDGFELAPGVEAVHKLVLNIIGDTLKIRNAKDYFGEERVFDQCNNRNEVEKKMRNERELNERNQEARELNERNQEARERVERPERVEQEAEEQVEEPVEEQRQGDEEADDE